MAEILGRQPLEDSDASLFRNNVDGETASGGCPNPEGEIPEGFQEREKPTRLSKKEKDRMSRKDAISNADLTEQKIKAVFKYPCCESHCLRELGRRGIAKHRRYYYGLTWTEKNIVLRGYMKGNHQGRTGYNISGKSICREGFKKLFSIGNDRLKRVSQDIFCRIANDAQCKEKSTVQLGVVQWLNDFFKTNVESLPNKDIFHLPDN